MAVNADGITSYFGTDILGSVRSVTDRNGQVEASYEYDAFGTPYVTNFDNGIMYGYTGKIFDSATGLYDYGFRDYNSASARFITIDPIRDGSNWYSYCMNDAVNYVDLWGLTATDAGRIEEGEKILQAASIKEDKLKDLVNTNNLADIMSSNIDCFDSATRAYYEGMPECVRTTAIREVINKTRVYSGVDENIANGVLNSFGSSFLDGLSLGDNIYIREEISNMYDSLADLLGHESVHSVSASVVGKTEFIMYNATAPYNENNQYENAAYKFGGWVNPDNFQTIDNDNQVFDRNPGWWK